MGNRKLLHINTSSKEKKKKKLKPHEILQRMLRKKYDDEKEISQFGIISKGRKAKDEALKKLNQY